MYRLSLEELPGGSKVQFMRELLVIDTSPSVAPEICKFLNFADVASNLPEPIVIFGKFTPCDSPDNDHRKVPNLSSWSLIRFMYRGLPN